MEKRIRSGIILILPLILGLAVYGWISHFPETGLATIRQADSKIGARALVDLASLNEGQFTQKYLYKTLSVSGIIREIRKGTPDSPGDYTIYLSGSSGHSCMVKCCMDSLYDRHQLRLMAGDSVVIRGTCAGRFMDVILLECILEKQVL
jgi:putative nucleic acid binding protein